MLFASLDTLIRERREELPSGRTRVLEDIIEPTAFFSETLFANLEDGKRGLRRVRYARLPGPSTFCYTPGA